MYQNTTFKIKWIERDFNHWSEPCNKIKMSLKKGEGELRSSAEWSFHLPLFYILYSIISIIINAFYTHFF